MEIPKKMLGSSDMEVSVVCLGTMTFGVQNSEEEAHAQLDYFVKKRGCNFIDTVRMAALQDSLDLSCEF
jgi:aryl-alcohol dehydrogenase-like predicted oxidoreductase